MTARFSVYPAETVHIPAPFFLNEHNDAISAKMCMLDIRLPKIDVVELKNASLVGGGDFIFVGKAALAPDCFIEFADTCPASLFGVTVISHSEQRLQLFISEKGIEIEAGISLLGQSTANYAHWLTETLPKIAILNDFPQYDDMPLLVDYGLHKNIYDSIGAVSRKKRKLIFVERWERIRVRRLVCVTQTSYEPYIPHGLFNTGTSKIINSFSIKALAALNTVVLDTIPQADALRGQKIFLCRHDQSNNLRALTNSLEVEALLLKKDFIFVDASKLTFSEQVRLCRAARIIVAPIGAALVNMIFAPAACHILALSPYYENANYYFYSNLAALLKVRFSYLLGRQINQGGHPMHRSYSIDLILLEHALDSLSKD